MKRLITTTAVAALVAVAAAGTAVAGERASIGAREYTANCAVCHGTTPTDPGPHGITVGQVRAFTFEPDHTGIALPGTTLYYTHILSNTGNVSDTFSLTWTTSQEWATDVVVKMDGSTVMLPATLQVGEFAEVQVTVQVPLAEISGWMTDTTVVTATSITLPLVYETVTDVTKVAEHAVFLPLVMR